MDSWIGQTLNDRFRVESRLGQGGMAAVYLASDLRLSGRRVVVKHPLREADRFSSGLSDEDLRKRFAKEVEGLTHLDDIPHVVPILDQGVHQGTPFYVMRHMAGGSLADVLKGGPQAPGEALAWLRPIAEALDRLHRRDVLHRDVKPENLLFDRPPGAPSGETPQAYLSDFGIVKELAAQWATTGKLNSGIGTPGYMAPEQLLEDAEPDGRADQFALAATLYHALTGSRPQYETTGGRPLRAQPALGGAEARGVRKRLTPVSRLAGHVPEGCSAVIERALAREPDERYATCGAFVAAFEAALSASDGTPSAAGAATAVPTRQAASPGRAPTAPPAAPAARARAGRRWLLGLLAVAALAGIGYAALQALGSRPATPTGPGAAPAPAAVPTPGPAPGPVPAPAPVAADKQAPEVRLSDPPADVTTTAAKVTLTGTVSEQGGLLSAVVLKDGSAAVALNASGAFSYEVALSVDEEREVKLVATDGAGNASAAVVRRLKREALWAGPLREAEAARAKEDGEAVKAALSKAKAADVPFAKVEALSEYVRQWDAEPAVQVSGTSPVGEASPGGPPRPMRVTGTFQSGRGSDRLLVDGREAAAKPGAFAATVTRSTPGVVELPYEVRAASGAMRKQGTFPVTFETPPPKPAPTPPAAPPVPAWAKVSSAQIAEAQRLGVPVAYEEPTTGIRFVLIPGGSFQMGSPDTDTSREPDEGPVHTVRLSAYYLSLTEVTNAQFERFVTATGHQTTAEREGTAFQLNPAADWEEVLGASWTRPLFGRRRQPDWAQHPVVLVSWDDAVAYASWAQALLPTEAQFEWALRGGVPGRRYPWGNSDAPPTRTGNYAGVETARSFPNWPYRVIAGYDDEYAGTAPAGSFDPNPFGLHDLAGNVWEWCADDWHETYAGASTDGSAWVDRPRAAMRILRGGSWTVDAQGLRSAERLGDVPTLRYGSVGFRLAKPVTSR